jgi:hypothetical protein
MGPGLEKVRSDPVRDRGSFLSLESASGKRLLRLVAMSTTVNLSKAGGGLSDAVRNAREPLENGASGEKKPVGRPKGSTKATVNGSDIRTAAINPKQIKQNLTTGNWLEVLEYHEQQMGLVSQSKLKKWSQTMTVDYFKVRRAISSKARLRPSWTA